MHRHNEALEPLQRGEMRVDKTTAEHCVAGYFAAIRTPRASLNG